jgi:AcrR family transcriptional regulator
VVVPAQVAFRQDVDHLVGLRSRKKIKTRLAIEDAALALFDTQGYDATTVEQIANRAEVSHTTFFRYFPSKADVVLSDPGQQLPALHAAIVERPATENDLIAVEHALLHAWVALVDPERTARKARTVTTSHLLRGQSFERGLRWLAVINDALAQRRGVDPSDERCAIAARMALGVLGSAVERWLDGGCRGDLAEGLEHSFAVMRKVCGEWSSAALPARGSKR